MKPAADIGEPRARRARRVQLVGFDDQSCKQLRVSHGFRELPLKRTERVLKRKAKWWRTTETGCAAYQGSLGSWFRNALLRTFVVHGCSKGVYTCLRKWGIAYANVTTASYPEIPKQTMHKCGKGGNPNAAQEEAEEQPEAIPEEEAVA